MWFKNTLQNSQSLLQLILLLVLPPKFLILQLIIINKKIRQSLTSVRISKVKRYQQA
jgi:hypothetical protein